MGAHMVARLIDAGHDLAVYDTRAEAMEPHVARGARACDSAAAVADVAGTVFVSLPTPDVVRAVAGDLAGGGALRAYVDLSTTGPAVAARGGRGPRRRRHRVPRRARERRRGGRAGRDADHHGRRRRGALRALRPVLEALGRNVVLVGAEPGQGQLAKVLNNLLSASAIAITGEALALGVHGGLSARTLLDVFNSSSGRKPRARTSSPGTCCRGPSAPASGSS